MAAKALESARALSDGFDTHIGENDNCLSGRQRQAVARAILKDVPILILDEATSALDNKSDRLVQEALERLMKDRTTRIIPHHLSTVERDDRIVVLDKGMKMEEGLRSELLTLGNL